MIAPAVPIADSRPTIDPLVEMSVRVARTIIGPTADRMAAGATKPTVARVTIAGNPSPSPTVPSTPTIGTEAMAATPPSTNDGPSSGRGPHRIGRPPANPRPERDAGEDRADDPGVGRQGYPDVRGK